MKILADAALPALKQLFPAPFVLTQYTHVDELDTLLTDQDVLLCRSSLKVNQELLKNSSIRYVATASSGSDNLDYFYLTKQHITALDAKGCNATSVADYVMSCLAYLEKTQQKRASKVGIIGMGYVGSQVYQRIHALNRQVIGFDPLKKAYTGCTQDELYSCDVLCIHASLHHDSPYPSYDLINEAFLTQLAPDCVIINASRGGIVNEEALLNSKVTYCTDVYLNEPNINKYIVARATLCTPHIAGHSIEAKLAAVYTISQKLHLLLGVTPPHHALPAPPVAPSLHMPMWYDNMLAHYNPLQETEQLKQANNLQEAFLELRKKHTYRHDAPIMLYG